MKITRRQLKQIIKEELTRVLMEQSSRIPDVEQAVTLDLGGLAATMEAMPEPRYDYPDSREPFVTSSLGPEVQWDPSMDRPGRPLMVQAGTGDPMVSRDMQRADLHDGNGRIHGRSDLQRADAARPRTAPSMGTGTSTSNAARRGRNVRRALGTAGRGARFLARQIPLVGAAMTIPSVARGDVHPAQWAAEQVPFLGTAMDLAQAAEEARPERAQEYERSYRTAMENPASQPFTAASQPPPRAMGTADTLRSWRPYRRVGPETGGGEAAWKRDDLNEQHIQQIIEAIMAIQGDHQ